MNLPLPGVLVRHRGVVVLCAAIVLNMLGQGVVAPSLPLFAKGFSAAPTLVGLAVVMIAAGRLLMSLPGGVLVQSLGRKPVLVAGLSVMGIGAIMVPFADNIGQLIAYRLVSGLGTGAFVLASMVYLRDVSTGSTRARYQSLNEMSILFGASIGAVVGGLAAEAWGLKSTFFLQAALSFAAVPVLILYLPETRRASRPAPSTLPSGPPGGVQSQSAVLRGLLLSPGFLAVAFLSLWIVTTRQGARFVVMPLFAGEKGFGPADLGFFFLCTHLPQFFAVLLSGFLTDRFGRKVPLLPAAVLVALGVAVFINTDSLWMLLASGAILGIGEGLAGPPTVTYFADVAPRGWEGVTMGLYGTFGGSGALLGALALGSIAELFSFQTALWVDVAVLLGLVLIVMAITRETGGRRRAHL